MLADQFSDFPNLQPCSRCGHRISARCEECKREMVCGAVAAPCPRDGCLEGVIAEKYGGADNDLHGPFEKPRRET